MQIRGGMKRAIVLVSVVACALTPRPAAAIASSQNGVDEQRLVYRHASEMDLSLDLFTPVEGGAANRPAIVFFFGGGWSSGSTKQFEPQSRAFAAHGYVAVSAQYRLSGTAPYPAAVTDAKAAIRWVRSHAAEYGIDPDRILVGGGSSGGHLAALIATTPGTWEDGDNLDVSSAVQGALLLNPVTDLRDQGASAGVHQSLINWLGGSLDEMSTAYEDASPIVHVTSATPPTLILHGSADTSVPYQESIAYMDAMKGVGAPVQFFTADGANHGFFNNPPWYEPTLAAMMDFADSIVGPAAHH